ncbi:MAG TPA: NCS1 family nucleobase:cation symporter-1, partial [Mycobacterium sp.]|nr:NCS1 family nucleobase:cation symporter-1 [Mycobacterium sp.]
ALVITAVVALLLAFVPVFAIVSEFSWFIGAGLGAIVYLAVADRRGPFNDVSGEPIAVASTH